MRLDRHALEQAISLLDEQAVSIAAGTQQPGWEKRLHEWFLERQRLRDRVTLMCHIEEMVRRLRRMLEQPKKSKGASRPKRRPVMTRKKQRKQQR